MSWNVWWRFGGEWQAREPRIRAVVKAVRPDILGLQETWRVGNTTQAELIARELGMHAAFTLAPVPPVPDPIEYPEQEGVEIGIAILSRWEIAEVVDHKLPARHRDPPSALVSTVAHPLGPLHVIVAITEWEPRYADDHLSQTRALAALVADSRLDGDLPVLLMGDMNAPPHSEEIAPIAAVAQDLWTAGGGDPQAVTLSASTPIAPLDATRQIDQRIDYIFARPGRPELPLTVQRSHLAGNQKVEGMFPSDHFATVSDLEI